MALLTRLGMQRGLSHVVQVRDRVIVRQLKVIFSLQISGVDDESYSMYEGSLPTGLDMCG